MPRSRRPATDAPREGKPSATTGDAFADARARQMIAERLDINLLVEAGAGSGKTECLANRMAAGIVSGQYSVEELAAVTFTRKAAAELRGRFQLALEKRLATAGDETVRARIERALRNLEHLFAGTIHAFCAHLLRERPVEAGIAPGFTELEELDDEELRQRAWRDYLSRLRAERSPLLGELQRARVSARDLDAAFATLCRFDEVEFPPGDAREPDLAGAREATGRFWADLRAFMPSPANAEAKCLMLTRLPRFRGLLRAAEGGRPADLIEALRFWEKPPALTMKWWAEGQPQARQREIREKVERLVESFRQSTVLPILLGWRAYLYRLAVTLLAEAREEARAERRRTLALNYGDLLTGAAALLRENAGVRAALQRKYRWLLVDEFQDTDPVQAEVVLLLAADGDGAGGSGAAIDPYTVPLRQGALFVVGDPKQSIYRFRRADIEVYGRVREAIERSGGLVASLTTSFRARPSLCEWTNEAFRALLPSGPTSHQAAFGPLDPNPGWTPRRTPMPPEPGLRTLTIPESVGKKDVAAEDARCIARYVRAEVDAGRAAYADFLVLTRKKKHLADYAAALQELRVPVDVSGAGAFGGSPLVGALVGLLRALADPADAVAVVGVLRGRLFGISDAQLFEHRSAGGYFSFSAAANAERSQGDGAPVEAALERLGAYLRLTRTLPLASAVERILEDSGLLALGSACEEGTQPAGDLLNAVDLARQASEDGASLADAVARLERAAESTETESLPLEPGRRDVVRLMNLHKAKGLEARVVFLADPLAAPMKTVDVRIVRDGPTARGYLLISRKVGEYGREPVAHPAEWNEHETAEAAYLDAEETRLLYVAATRARELLVVSRYEKAAKDAAGRPWAALEDYLGGAPALELPDVRPAATTRKPARQAATRREARAGRERRLALASRPTWATTSVTGDRDEGAAEQSVVPAPSAGDAGERGIAPAAAAATPAAGSAARRADAGPAWGTLVHGLLEYAARHLGATPLDLQRVARWLAAQSELSEDIAQSAVETVRRVTSEPFWHEAAASGTMASEVPFAVQIPRGSRLGPLGPVEVPTVLQGIIDLLYRARDGWVILDYKTDLGVGPAGSLVQRHGSQLAQYRAAWERATGEKVVRQGIVSARTGAVEWA